MAYGVMWLFHFKWKLWLDIKRDNIFFSQREQYNEQREQNKDIIHVKFG